MFQFGGIKRNDCPDIPGAFTDNLNEDNWLIRKDDVGFYVVWLSGSHYLQGVARRLYSRKNRYGKEYWQFLRPRLPGERLGRMICVPIEAVKEVTNA